MTQLSEVFYVCLVTTVSALILKLASLCFKSKCSSCEICGGRIKIIRNVDVEERQTEFELTHKQTSSLDEK
jgi:hypothetical protein